LYKKKYSVHREEAEKNSSISPQIFRFPQLNFMVLQSLRLLLRRLCSFTPTGGLSFIPRRCFDLCSAFIELRVFLPRLAAQYSTRLPNEPEHLLYRPPWDAFGCCQEQIQTKRYAKF
jgi:hypothetical protein